MFRSLSGESFMFAMSAALLFSVRLLDHGQSLGTFCKTVVSVKMVVQCFLVPVKSVLLRAARVSQRGCSPSHLSGMGGSPGIPLPFLSSLRQEGCLCPHNCFPLPPTLV